MKKGFLLGKTSSEQCRDEGLGPLRDARSSHLTWREWAQAPGGSASLGNNNKMPKPQGPPSGFERPPSSMWASASSSPSSSGKATTALARDGNKAIDEQGEHAMDEEGVGGQDRSFDPMEDAEEDQHATDEDDMGRQDQSLDPMEDSKEAVDAKEDDFEIPPPKGTEGAPRAALNNLFTTLQYTQSGVGKEYYIAWSDGGPTHKQRFTAMFVHTKTGEVFLSGRYGNEMYYSVQNLEKTSANHQPDPRINQLVWYTTQNMAKHGAAARAYDCLTSRTGRYRQIGIDEPYTEPLFVKDIASVEGIRATIPKDAWANILSLDAIIMNQTLAQTQQLNMPKGLSNDAQGKSLIREWFLQRHHIYVDKESYVSWSDDGPAHDKWFTCMFVMPFTGECFIAGCNGQYKKIEEKTNKGGETVKIVWYKTKKLAEHAAAARAWQSLSTDREPPKNPWVVLDNCSGNIPSHAFDQAYHVVCRAQGQPEQAKRLYQRPVPIDHPENAWRPRPPETEV